MYFMLWIKSFLTKMPITYDLRTPIAEVIRKKIRFPWCLSKAALASCFCNSVMQKGRSLILLVSIRCLYQVNNISYAVVFDFRENIFCKIMCAVPCTICCVVGNLMCFWKPSIKNRERCFTKIQKYTLCVVQFSHKIHLNDDNI